MEEIDKFRLEIYKTYVSSADANSARRQVSNNYFLTINTLLIGASGYTSNVNILYALLFSIIGIVICFMWVSFLWSYRNLNRRKFEIIHELELSLPFSPYTREWAGRKEGAGISYIGVTRLEMILPLAFSICHLSALLIKMLVA
jgi:hypothetical protein